MTPAPLFSRLLRSEDGATAVEYGLIAGLIGLALAGILTAIGVDLASVFQTSADTIKPSTGA